MSRLVARTVRLDHDVDLLDAAAGDGMLFEQHRHGIAGRGEARRSTVDRVADDLAAVEIDDEVGLPGTGAIAFGALPFLVAGGDPLVIPEVVLGRAADGTKWRTTITPDGRPPSVGAVGDPGPPLRRAPGRQPREFCVRAARPPEDWCAAVAEGRDRIRSGALEKVVLARELLIEADEPIDRDGVLQRLRDAFPSSYVYAVGGFIGASPELLVSRVGDIVRSHPLAGTAPRSNDPTVDARLAAELIASTKNQREHRITIDFVHDALLPYCSYLDEEAEPSIVAVANVQHLGTLVEGRLSAPPPSVLTLVAALHPTPAVGGYPRPDALRLIAEIEGFDRGRYAGAVGWVDHKGQGRFAVAIRCADIDGRKARVVAGNGIVARSDPEAELAETRSKFQAMLSALVRV